jgi:hypothetical protein
LNRLFVLIVAVVAVALVGVGCGSGDSTTESTASLSKAAFLKQGNAICKTGNNEIEEGFEAFVKENKISQTKEPTEAQFEEIADNVLVPAVEKQINGLRGLGTPEGDEGELDELLTNAEGALEEVEGDPSLLEEEGSGSPFAAVNKEARAYGLTVCGEENG